MLQSIDIAPIRPSTEGRAPAPRPAREHALAALHDALTFYEEALEDDRAGALGDEPRLDGP